MINLKATKMLGGVETEIQLEGAPFDVVDEMSLSLVHIINMMAKTENLISDDIDPEEAKLVLLKSIFELAAHALLDDGYEDIDLTDEEEDSMEEDLF